MAKAKSQLESVHIGGHEVHPFDPSTGATAWCERCGANTPTAFNVLECVLVSGDCQCVYRYGGSKMQCRSKPLPGSKYCGEHPNGTWGHRDERLESLTLRKER